MFLYSKYSYIGGIMQKYNTNSDDILMLLDLEDSDVIISDIYTENDKKYIVIETRPDTHYCPRCNHRMYSRGTKPRKINHPILQDTYSLTLILKQRRWMCTNDDCKYNVAESFRFVDKNKRTTNATDMLIVLEYKNLSMSTTAIAKKYNVSDTYAHDVFNKYVKLDRLPLTEAICVDEVHIDMDDNCAYAMIIQDFITGDPNINYRSQPLMDKHLHCLMNTYDYEDAILSLDSDLRELRELKELYVSFNTRNAGNPINAAKEINTLIDTYQACGQPIFENFANLLEKHKEYIINSFVMIEKIGKDGTYYSRLSNGPVESINRKVKDLKRSGRGFRSFDHFRNRFLYATRSEPVLNGIANYNPVKYYR